MTVARLAHRLLPVIYEDDHYLAVNKPARFNLAMPVRRRGPTVLEVCVTAQHRTRRDGADPDAEGGVSSAGRETLLPLIVPEWAASGVALFARSAQAQTRFAAVADSGRVLYQHLAVVQGAPSRRRLEIKPVLASGAGRRRGPTRAAVRPLARIEVLRSVQDLHVARCRTPALTLDEVRRCLRAAGLTIEGDVRPERVLEQARKPNRRLMTHLEQIECPHPCARHPLQITAQLPRSFVAYLTERRTVEDHLHAALLGRAGLLLGEDCDCLRLFCGRTEGVGGLLVDLFGSVLVLETMPGKFQGTEMQVRQVANWYAGHVGAPTVWWKVLPARREGRVAAPADPEQPLLTLLRGPQSEEVIVREGAWRFIARPGVELSPGLFADQRENRKRVARLAQGGRMLNLFAYTCGFSVAAASGGATSTTSVDLSAGNLEWGKRNFLLNELDPDGHTFIRSDAFEYFQRARRQGHTFDLIVCDPPSFSRSKRPKRTFQIRQHLAELLTGALSLLNPGGHMLISTNLRTATTAWLTEQAERAGTAAARRCRPVARPALPADFAPDPDHQKTIIVSFD